MHKTKFSQLKTGAILSYLSLGLNIAAGLLYTPWMIAQIGQGDYGIYTLANSIISMVMLDFGMGSATTRFVAKYRVSHDEDKVQTFLATVYQLYLLIDALIFVFFIVVYFNLESIYKNFSYEEIQKLRVVFCIAGGFSLISFPCTTFNGILTAYERFIPLKIADIIQRLGAILLTVIALCGGMGLYALVAANAIAGIIAISIKFYFVRRAVPFPRIFARGRKKKTPMLREIFSYSLWDTVCSLAQRLIMNVMPTILGIVALEASVSIAVFGIVSTIEGYFYSFTSAINGMFLARITKISMDDQDGSKLTDLAVRVGRFQFSLNGLLIVGFALVGKEFIMLWMGEDFLPAYVGILLIVIPGIFYNALQIARSAIMANNQIRYLAYIQIAISVVNLIFAPVFAAKWGVIGACGSIFIAYTLRIFLTLLVVRKKLNFQLQRYIRQCYGRMSVPVLLALVICEVFLRGFSAESWMELVVKGAIVVGVYLLCLVLTGLTADERSGIRNRLHCFRRGK